MTADRSDDHVAALAEIERLQLELHGALIQLEELRTIGDEIAEIKSSRSYRLARRLDRLARRFRRQS